MLSTFLVICNFIYDDFNFQKISRLFSIKSIFGYKYRIFVFHAFQNNKDWLKSKYIGLNEKLLKINHTALFFINLK